MIRLKQVTEVGGSKWRPYGPMGCYQLTNKTKTSRVMKWRRAGPMRANQGTRTTEGGQVKEGEDEEPINSHCGEQIGEVAGLQPQHFIPGTY